MYDTPKTPAATTKAILARIPTMDRTELEWAVGKLTEHIDTLEAELENTSTWWLEACHDRDRLATNVGNLITANKGQAVMLREQGFSLAKRMEATA